MTCKIACLFLGNILPAHTFSILTLRGATSGTGLCYPQLQDHSDCPRARPSGVPGPITQELASGRIPGRWPPGRWPQRLASPPHLKELQHWQVPFEVQMKPSSYFLKISQLNRVILCPLMLTVDTRLAFPKARTLKLQPSKHQLQFSYGPTTSKTNPSLHFVQSLFCFMP